MTFACSRRAPARARRRAAFSLIEVMCAILVLGIGIAGLTEGLTTALRSSRESQLQSTATLYAAGRIEELRSEGFLTDGETEGECSEGLPSCRWRQTVASTDLEGLHDVTVVIESSRTGKPVCELKTLLFEAPGGSLTNTTGRGSDSSSRRRDRDRERGGGR